MIKNFKGFINEVQRKIGTLGAQDADNGAITGGTISGAVITDQFTTSTDPASSAAVTTAIVDAYNGVVITLTGAGNAQTIAAPSAATVKRFQVFNNDTSTNSIAINGITLQPGKGQSFVYDGSAWGPIDIGITAIPVPETQGGTGQSSMAAKNPPIDADLAVYRDSAASDALVTSTWTQVKAFLKTYFDSIYDAAGTAAGKIASSISDGDTTHAPDGNSVFDALALKAPLASPTFTTQITTPVVYGSSAADGDITIEGTSSATKTTSYVILHPTSGNVGIGTTLPAAILHINNDFSAATYERLLQGRSSGNNSFGIGVGGNDTYISAAGAGGMHFATNSNLGVTGTSVPTNVTMSILNTGNVGIGTTLPAAILHINNDFSAATYERLLQGRSSGNNSFGIGVGGNDTYISAAGAGGMHFATNSNLGVTGTSVPTNVTMSILNTGNVGIGTTLPAAILHINNDFSAATYERLLQGRSSGNNSFGIGVGGNDTYISAAGAGGMHFATNSNLGVTGTSVPTNVTMSILNTGNVGIGTTLPAAILHI